MMQLGMIHLGAIAQLGERRHGMAEVEGSSPSSSIELAGLLSSEQHAADTENAKADELFR
jgi:hypothetical protein